MDNDPRTGILGLVWDRSRVLRYIRMGLIVTFPHLDISTPTFDSYIATLVSLANYSLLSVFAQIIVFSRLL
jgi:hypothetical protein